MNPTQFWRRAADTQALYRTPFHCSILTDAEIQQGVRDFIHDIEVLIAEWEGTSKDDGTKRPV